MTTPRQLKSMYEQGTNISALLREESGLRYNSEETIEIAYDLQTGTYTAAMADARIAAYQEGYTAAIAETIRGLCAPTSILEAGVGEATTLSGVLQKLGPDLRGFGFDLSWSRVAYANRWLQRQGVSNATLCTGSLLNIPFADDAIDVVYTSHSIEPNGGREAPILRELLRVARRFVVLLEPGYELGSDEARRRMDAHGYCRDLKGVATSLGYEVLEHRLFPFTANPLNPTALTVIRKGGDAPPPAHTLACPRFKTPLEEIDGVLFSPEALVAYPIVGGVPCLRLENGIVASRYKEVMGDRRDL